jgi:hypothetical protein
MRIPVVVMAFLGVLVVVPAYGACTPEQLETFLQSGISRSVIDQACGASNSPSSTQSMLPDPQPYSMAQICQTSYGSCAMVVRMPTGQECRCTSVWGPIPGVSR